MQKNRYLGEKLFMDFKTELEELLRRYVPVFTDDKEQYENTIKLLSIKIEDLYEKYKKD